MSQNRHLLIHKSEWARMKKQLLDCENTITKKDDYIKSLNEQSQKWIKNWPDTVQGHVCNVEKHNKAEKLKFIETVKKYSSKNKLKTNIKCIEKAKELIFEDSCYGRQLLSALLESKTLEERDEQIKFQNKTKYQADTLQNEPRATSLVNANEMEINEIKIKEYQKQNAFEIAHANRAMFDKQKADQLLEKERAKQEKSDGDVMRILIKAEKKIMIEEVLLHKESLKEYENINKKIKELKALTKIEDERQRTVWQNYQERVNYKSKISFDEMHKNKANRLQYRKVYENIKQLNEERDQKYNDFVNKGIRLSKDSLKRHEEDKAKNNILQCNVRKLLDEENKILANLHKDISRKKQTCECHRQAFIGKNSCIIKHKSDTSGPLFLKSKNTLLENLRKRQQASSENPIQCKHAYFAERAADTLRQCRYKNMALKVLNNYRQDNGLNATSMPVDNF